MLHAVFNSDGTQEIPESFQEKHIRVNDLRDKSEAEKTSECEAVRKRLSHNVLDIEREYERILIPDVRSVLIHYLLSCREYQ